MITDFLCIITDNVNTSKQELSGSRVKNTMQTRPCNLHPLTPHFYILKLGFTGVYIFFLIFALKHRLWVLVEAVLTCTHVLCLEQK